MSPLFVLVGSGECVDDNHISCASVLVLRGASDWPGGLSDDAPAS